MRGTLVPGGSPVKGLFPLLGLFSDRAGRGHDPRPVLELEQHRAHGRAALEDAAEPILQISPDRVVPPGVDVVVLRFPATTTHRSP